MTPNGAAIKALRNARRVSLRRLAHLTNRAPSHLNRIETGQRGASQETLYRIATALEVPVEAITNKGEAA